jgi:hypothetical protein
MRRRTTTTMSTTTRTTDAPRAREILAGEPRYRVDQVWRGLYEQLCAPDELTPCRGVARTNRETLPLP